MDSLDNIIYIIISYVYTLIDVLIILVQLVGFFCGIYAICKSQFLAACAFMLVAIFIQLLKIHAAQYQYDMIDKEKENG